MRYRRIAVAVLMTCALTGCKQQPPQQEANPADTAVGPANVPELALKDRGAYAYVSWRDKTAFVARQYEAIAREALGATEEADSTWSVVHGEGTVKLDVTRFDDLVPEGIYDVQVGDVRVQPQCACTKNRDGKKQDCTKQRPGVWFTFSQDAYKQCEKAGREDKCTETYTDVGETTMFSDDKCTVQVGQPRKIRDWACT